MGLKMKKYGINIVPVYGSDFVCIRLCDTLKQALELEKEFVKLGLGFVAITEEKVKDKKEE